MPAYRLHRRSFLGTCFGAAVATVTGGVQAAPWPERTLTVIVPYAAGGQGDVFARLVGDRLGRALGQRAIVDNRPGASGALGTRLAAKAPADGYTLLLGQTGEMAINGTAMKNPPTHPPSRTRSQASISACGAATSRPASRRRRWFNAFRRRSNASLPNPNCASAWRPTAAPWHREPRTLRSHGS